MMTKCKESEQLVLLDDEAPYHYSENSCLLSIGCFSRLSCLKRADTLESPTVIPEARPVAPLERAKLRAPPPPKAKPKALIRQKSCPATEWKGPKPTQGLKAQRVVDWNPIRQQGLLEGSVWQQVNCNIGKRRSHLLAAEALDEAFMRPATEVTKPGPKPSLGIDKSALPRRSPMRKHSEKNTCRRILQPKQAFMADVLHQQLAKRGLTNLKLLHGVIGEQPASSCHQQSMEAASDLERIRHMSSSMSSMSSMSSSEDDDTETSSSGSSDTSGGSSDEEEGESHEKEIVDAEALRILLDYLRLAESIQDTPKAKSGECSAAPLAESELFLQQLVAKGGPPTLLRARVQAAITMGGFPKEVDDLEKGICIGIQAIKTVLDSTAIPVLLEGVLLLGNYVNSSSALGSAAGVTLESLAKLAHTKANTLATADKSTPKDTKKEGQNAICLLVRELQESQGTTWLCSLLSELQDCRAACDAMNQASTSTKELQKQVGVVENCISLGGGTVDIGPASTVQARCRRFMAYSTSRLATLRAIEEDLVSRTVEMRKYFAESPDTSLAAMLNSLASLLDVLPKADATVAKQM